ncbi:MAG: hypothetical protein EOO18_13970, partial [Chryseobacterium sp.]
FCVNGCNAGNLYSYDEPRFGLLSTLSEKWVLAKNRGSIGFIASTHFGLENYLDYYNTGLYRSMGVTGYGKTIGQPTARIRFSPGRKAMQDWQSIFRNLWKAKIYRNIWFTMSIGMRKMWRFWCLTINLKFQKRSLQKK